MSVRTALFQHQLDAIAWMAEVEARPDEVHGGVIAHDMGMGKTKCVLRYLDLKAKMTTLIICPKSVISQWLAEIKTSTSFTNDEIHLYNGKRRHELGDHLCTTATIDAQQTQWHTVSRNLFTLRRAVVLTTFDIVRIDAATPQSF